MTTTIGLALLLAGCSTNSTSGWSYDGSNKLGTVIPADQRKQAGDLAGTLMDGSSYQLESEHGRVLLLNVLAEWCGPCQVETPQLDQIYRDNKTDGLSVVGVMVKSQRPKAEQFLSDKKVSFPVLWDPTGKALLGLGNLPDTALPETVLIDKAGRVAAVYVGAVTPADLAEPLKNLGAQA